MIKTKSGRGSVGRAMNRLRFKEQQPEKYRERMDQSNFIKRKNYSKIKERYNQRCIDCDDLISRTGIRCMRCHNKKRTQTRMGK